MINGLTRSIGLLLAIFCLFNDGYGQATNKNGRLINVKDHQAVGDGTTDDTAAIQAAISHAAAGDTVFIPEGSYLVRSLGLKSGTHIKGEGMLIQRVEGVKEEVTTEKQNSSMPLFRGHNVDNVFLSVRAQTVYEAAYFSGSKNISISHSTLLGDPTNPRSFSGLLFYDCENIDVANTKISFYGAPRELPDVYQRGTAIRVLSSRDIRVEHCEITQNGENGIFMHGTPDGAVENNIISNNGMSAIQVAFGTTGKEKNYRFIKNVMEGNAADAIDINNRSARPHWDINCHIEDNLSRNNGFVKGQSTPDGSGIATLINLSGVTMLNNVAAGNNRPALYIENCGKIYASGNKADNQVEVVLQFDELRLEDNSFGSISLLANVDGKKLLMHNNQLYSMSLPNGIKVDSLILSSNLISKATLNFNMTGNIRLKENTINSHSKDGALLLVKVNSAYLERNIITSLGSYAISTRKTAENVEILDNDINSVNACILDDGAVGLRVIGNKLLSLEGGGFRHTVVSRSPDRLVLSKNEHTTTPKHAAIYLEGQGTAEIISEKIISGAVDYGTVDVKTSLK
ncbi:MAG TPA: glycosyl hydrolase family 28-related protein [Cyclobacteriaceae bacterium]|nr:glycosyl hydrolase family 28-related protein [Cyclobacteriaceae bacterium]